MTEELRCDFALEDPVTHRVILTDTKVTHPSRVDPATRTKPLAAAEKAWKEKRRKYLSHYDMPEETIQPLVFETHGGYAQKTYGFLRELVQGMAKGDNNLSSALWQDLRNRIAVYLARGQAEVVRYFNFRNGTTSHYDHQARRRPTAQQGSTAASPLHAAPGAAPVGTSQGAVQSMVDGEGVGDEMDVVNGGGDAVMVQHGDSLASTGVQE